MSYEVRHYRASDIFEIEHRKEELDEFIGMGLDPNDLNEFYLSGYGFTLLYDDVILCCGGIIPVWPGLGQVWWRASVHMHNHGKMVIETTRSELHREMHDFRRVETNVIKDWEEAISFIELMGFHHESDMIKYGPHGETQCCYVILPGEEKTNG
jgi:hypothetical protein